MGGNTLKKFRCLIISVLCLLTLTACSSGEDVATVDDLITNIGSVTLDSENSILEAEQAYDALSKWDKRNVENYQVLTEARETYDRIRNVSDLIQRLETVTLDSKDDIAAAESAYEALSSTEKQSIQNHDILVDARARYDSLSRIDAVETAIDAVKSIEKIKNEDDLAPYTSAKEAYDALADDEKSLVQNYNILTEFEANLPIGWKISSLLQVSTGNLLILK